MSEARRMPLTMTMALLSACTSLAMTFDKISWLKFSRRTWEIFCWLAWYFFTKYITAVSLPLAISPTKPMIIFLSDILILFNNILQPSPDIPVVRVQVGEEFQVRVNFQKRLVHFVGDAAQSRVHRDTGAQFGYIYRGRQAETKAAGDVKAHGNVVLFIYRRGFQLLNALVLFGYQLHGLLAQIDRQLFKVPIVKAPFCSKKRHAVGAVAVALE